MDKLDSPTTTNQAPTPTTPAPPSVPGISKTSLLQLLKTNRKTQISAAALAFLIVATVAVSIQLFTSRSRIQFEEKPIAFPSPSPRQTTRFATHPIVLEAESQVASSQAQLNDLKINNHPLLPPILDMQVALEK